MRKMTSAGANKLLRKLREDRDFWTRKEDERQIYIAAADEAPVVPEYDYEETAGKSLRSTTRSCGSSMRSIRPMSAIRFP